ncbi:MAG: 4Fe-4S binding protein [Deltaproteobacteria bacterium]|jgi:NAD-dependent dihydropyrimidine dehydrogenase PreA subunit|nr:4Fe-4S binding protein [Deltaproteobacteria bacterium]
MIRKIISIDAGKCDGCGLCAAACHEGAIAMRDGKAALLRDDYCDGLGDCLPACPAGAISFIEREALPYDEEAVKAKMAAAKLTPPVCGCSGSQARALAPRAGTAAPAGGIAAGNAGSVKSESQLAQWPVQIRLAPASAPFFADAELLVAADCSAFAYGNFHEDFMKGRVTLIGCPKLDGVDYSGKLAAILTENSVRSVTVVRMSVPCCGGLEQAVSRAVLASGKALALEVVTLGTDGTLLRA